MDHQLYILGIGGSPRRGGNTEIILDHVIQGAKSQGVITETINLRTLRIKQCTACESCRTARICRAHRDDMQLIYSKIKAARGLVLGSPTHSYNVSTKMKVFLDRLYPFYHYNPEDRHDWHSLMPENKKAVIFSVCEQPGIENLGVAADAMRLPLQALGYEIVSSFAAVGFSKKGAVLKDEQQLKAAFEAGVKLAKSILT